MWHVSVLWPGQVMSWNELEIKDHVQVKDADMNIYSNAVVVGMHSDGTYDVEYDVSAFPGHPPGLWCPDRR